VPVREVQAKSILRKYKKIDSWFVTRYGMNLYRGCQHNCAYCDGRAERYQIAGEFGTHIEVKTTAVSILQRELDPHRKRKPLKRCFMTLGGGVADAYQPAERKYRLARSVLELLSQLDFPVHILTKSTLILRDIDLLKKIQAQTQAVISFSFSTVDDELSRIFEPGVPAPSERLQAIKVLKQSGFACGMFLLPVIPMLTDRLYLLEAAVRAAADAGVDFVLFGGMTLRPGRQKDYFLHILKQQFPEQYPKYESLYPDNPWGTVQKEYSDNLHQTLFALLKKYRIPLRMPPNLFSRFLDHNDRLVVILEQLDYLLNLRGRSSPYGYAAYSISRLKEPISTLDNPESLRGVGPVTGRLIREILETGSSKLYHKLLFYH